MLKVLALLFAVAAGCAATFVAGSTVYSPFQFQLPLPGLKVTPDPANIWSWHSNISLPPTTKLTTLFEQVLVDFDNNGKMDTEYPELRVLITDIQFFEPTAKGL